MFFGNSASVNNAGYRCLFSTAGVGWLLEQTCYCITFLVLLEVVGAPLTAALLALDGCLGFAGWQWIFNVKGLALQLLFCSTASVVAAGHWCSSSSSTFSVRRFPGSGRLAVAIHCGRNPYSADGHLHQSQSGRVPSQSILLDSC